VNLLNSLTGDAFAAWVKSEVDAHRAGQQEGEGLELDPAVAEAFR
jgi:heme-degrading monooxygenase HmoA